MTWTRPENVRFPMVWHRFRARDGSGSGGDQLVEYRVEDLTEDRYDDVIKHYTENYVDDEPLAAQRGVGQDPDAMEDHDKFWRWCFSQRLTIVCYKEGSDEIVGANLLLVTLANEGKKEIHTKSQSTRDIIEIHQYMFERFNVCEHYGVDKCLTAAGLAINRRYRGLGIATEMLKARVPICRLLGFRVSATDFTTEASQVPAAKVGFRTDLEVTYEEFAKIRPNFAYPGIKARSMKMMCLIVD